MKIYTVYFSSFCLSSFLLLFITNNFIVVNTSQIIGSSVVTSVSVIHGDEKKNSPTTLPPKGYSTTSNVSSHKLDVTLRPDTKSGDEGVLSVIATLKSIVEKEQKKHDYENRDENFRTTNAADVESTDKSSTILKTSKHSSEGEDEDDEADDGQNHTEVPLTKKIETDTPAENETATSVEVHAAIHRISGALLKPGKKSSKPIENILTDVLTSINGARNTSTGASGIPTTIVPDIAVPSKSKSKTSAPSRTTTTLKPKKTPSRTNPTNYPSSRPTSPTTTKIHISKTKVPSSSVKVVVPASSHSTSKPPPIKIQNIIREPQIGNTVHLQISGIQVDENISPEVDTVEDLLEFSTITYKPKPKPTATATTIKPKPQYIYSMSGGRNNVTVTNTRPAEFYDDEIFGYDPYQTFLHGIYVPIVEVDGNLGALVNTAANTEPVAATTTCKTEPDTTPQRKPVSTQQSIHPSVTIKPQHHSPPDKPTSKPSTLSNSHGNQKPVPNLPDHLHRPRPSHLQYQHTAAESVDTETGQVTVKVPHPAEKHTNPNENFAPDRLSTLPRTTLPPSIVKNLTDHHNAAHHGHGHGGHEHAHQSGHHHHAGHDHTHHSGNDHGHHAGSDHTHSVGNEHAHHTGHDHVNHAGHDHHHHHGPHDGSNPERRPTFDKAPNGNPGLEATITNLDPEMRSFVDINNRVALRLFSSLTNPVSKAASSYNNMVMSPFTIISSLGMLFLGARGSTAAQLDGLFNFDDMQTFNPHMMYYNVTQSFLSQPNTAAAVIRLVIADKEKGDVLDFFKTRVQHFYDTRVEEADYKFAGHLAQSIINQMIRAQIQRHSYEMLNYSLPLKGPMSLITAAFFDGQFSGARDLTVKDMHFIHLAALGRRLIQVPAVSLRGPMRAAYDGELDVTAVDIPYSTRDLSLILLMPGRPGEFAIGGVNSLKSRLTLEAWTNLMRGFYSRDSFKIIFPRFTHHTSLNLSYTMQRFGLSDMFQPHLAKFKGINGLNDLYLDQNMQHFSEFGTWEKLSDTLSEANLERNKKFDLIRILRPQVREQYGTSAEPLSVGDWIFNSRSPTLSPRHSNFQSYQPFFSYSRVRSSRTGRRQPRSKSYYFNRQESTDNIDDEKVLRFEKPFLYVLRHNPTGMILMTGQYTEPVTEE